MNGRPKAMGKWSDVRVEVAAEAERCLRLARRVGKRLQYQLDQRNKNKEWVPSLDWTQAAKWYERTIVELSRFADEQIIDDMSDGGRSVSTLLDDAIKDETR